MKKISAILKITSLGLIFSISCSSGQNNVETAAEVSTEELPESAVSEEWTEEADIGTVSFPDQLEQCTIHSETFTHPFTGEKLNREILGLDNNGLCEHREEMPNGGLMSCKYSEQTRKVMAQYYKDTNLSGPGSMGFNTKMYTIEGKTVTNPLDEVMNNGTCTISGY